MSGFKIAKSQPVTVLSFSGRTIGDGQFIQIPDTVVNYNDSGLFYYGSVVSSTLYNLASKGIPQIRVITGLYLKYGCDDGNQYTGGTNNRFIVTLYKNNGAVLTMNVDNPSSSTGPIIQYMGGYIPMTPSDTWAVGIAPTMTAGQAPTSGQNVWSGYITFQ